jgi:hypothetical protein
LGEIGDVLVCEHWDVAYDFVDYVWLGRVFGDRVVADVLSAAESAEGEGV